MQEVTKKIEELVSLLEAKLSATDILNSQLSKQKLTLEDLEKKAVAKLNHVSAMERVYKKYVLKSKDLEERIKKAQAQEDNDVRVLKQIKEESMALNARKIALNKQAEALDKKELELKEAKAQLKSFMNGESLKGILK
jgi:ABC-type molybdate transport system ATPase subunit